MEQKKFVCSVCDKSFSSRKGESQHRIRLHGLKKPRSHVYCQEIDCEDEFQSLKDFRNHLKIHHSFQRINDAETQEFNSREDFYQWLAKEETQTNTHFVLTCGEKKCKNYQQISYVCNRSGKYVSASTGKRQLKAQGSVKSGFHCTAQINVKVFDSHVEVVYYKEHYNHNFLLGHVPLQKSVRQSIAGKLLQGVSEKRILQDIRGDFSDDPGCSKRHHIITKKDIQNVKSVYKLQLPSRCSTVANEELSLKAWVEQIKKEGGTVFCYKERNTDHDILEYEDFFLAFQMPIQKKMFEVFGSDRICVDSTRETTGHGLELITVLVIDEYEEGFPIVFCLTSSVNYTTMSYYYQCLKASTSQIKTCVFMSDDASFQYTAWEDVFGPAEVHLLCPWHVDRAWQDKLHLVPAYKRAELYKMLKSLMYELDKNVFSAMLENFLSQLSDDDDTEHFHSYFCAYYSMRAETWAYCFRKGAKLNTNMHIEQLHRELKHIYLEGKKSQRVDKCCMALVSYVNDKGVGTLINFHKGKITKKHTNSMHRHKDGEEIVNVCHKIGDNKWIVQSSSSSMTYDVKRIHECNNNCNLLCRQCYCCLKAFVCTCHDFANQNNLCKHIHAININEKKKVNYSGPLNNILMQKIPDVKSPPITVSKPSTSKTMINKRLILKKLSSIESKIQLQDEINEDVSLQLMQLLQNAESLID